MSQLTFQPILQAIANNPRSSNPQYLVDLVASIRPKKSARNKAKIAEERINRLVQELREKPDLAVALREYIFSLLENTSHLSLYSEAGVQSQHGFFSEAFEKITHLILPPLQSDDTLRGVLNLAFHESNDYRWVSALSDDVLLALLTTLKFAGFETAPTVYSASFQKLLNAILVLSHKLAAMGAEADIIVRLPNVNQDRTASIVAKSMPFLEQNRELTRYVERLQVSSELSLRSESSDAEHALVMLSQCEDCVEYIRKHRGQSGTSLGLTYQLQRMMQHIERLRTLIHLTFKPQNGAEAHQRLIIGFWKEILEAENTRDRLTKHFADNTALLAFQIAENAAKTGEHYITTTRKEFWAFFTSSAGGGMIVAFLVCFKLWISLAHFPPFGEALFFSLNYACGFMLIHILGFKLATKQPAMTASAIAESLDVRRKSVHSGEISLQNLVKTIAQISRSQLVSFVGNVVVAFPLGLVLTGFWYLLTNEPIAQSAKANKILQELHPFLSLSLIHAGIAGVFLFLSGLISGYYDNSVVFNNIPARLRHHPLLKKILSPRSLVRFAAYIEHNLGALAGNFFFGFMLGTISTIGFILGLPLDIRHITFAAANAAVGFFSKMILHEPIEMSVVAWTVIGIVGIGAMNFLVSFSLALFVAIRSRNVNIRQSRELLGLLAKYFLTNTREFFLPPRKNEAESNGKSDAH